MRANEFVTERKKRKHRSRYFSGYWYPGYGYYGSGTGSESSDSGGGNGGGDGGVGESVKKGTNDYLWHGSKRRNDILIPRQAKDTGGAEGSNKNAVYATPDAKVAIAMGLTTPGSETGMFPNDPQMVLFKGGMRKGEMVYLHKVPKDLFIQHNSREWYSKPDVKEITPIEIKEVPVDKYLDLIRQATPKDLELRNKFMKKSVDENFADGKVKGKSRPGRVKRAGASCNGSVTDLRKRAKNTSGEKAKMYHWCANMKGGRQK